MSGTGENAPHLAHRYLFGDGADEILASENAAGAVLWGLGDHEGTIRDIINNSGVLQDHRKYDSFGKTTSESAPATDFIFGFDGMPFDSAKGLYDTDTRPYEPSTGRFLSEDPTTPRPDPNVYRWCRNNPINTIDPSGRCGRAANSSSSAIWNSLNSSSFSGVFGSGSSYVTSGSTPLTGGYSIPSVSSVMTSNTYGLGSTQADFAAMNVAQHSANVAAINDQFTSAWSEGFRENARLYARGDMIEAGISGAFAGTGQGVLNAINGVQDIGIGLGNMAIQGSVPLPARMAMDLTGYQIPSIPSPDWSRGMASYETDLGHGISKFAGGNAVVTAATLGAGAFANAASKAEAAANAGRLVHLTNAEAGASINGSRTLIGNTYAGPLSNAGTSGLGVTLRTGLSPSAYEVAVPIPQAAQGAFSTVKPIGLLTSGQYLTGQQYTANGVLNLTTGAFARQGVNWNQALIYGVDATATGTTVGAGGYYLYKNNANTKKTH